MESKDHSDHSRLQAEQQASYYSSSSTLARDHTVYCWYQQQATRVHPYFQIRRASEQRAAKELKLHISLLCD
jgi:hypothetical protein